GLERVPGEARRGRLGRNVEPGVDFRAADGFVGAVERELGRAASRAQVERVEDVVAQLGGQAAEARQLRAGDGQEASVFFADDLVRARHVGRARVVLPRERANAGVGVGDVAGRHARV